MMTSISVIIPVRNGEQYILDAIECVLSQTITPSQVIVIDNESTDGTAQIVQQFPEVIYHHQQDRGPAGGRNAGLALATGNYISFLDADDVWPLDQLEKLSTYLNEHQEVLVVMGQAQFVYLDGAKMRFTGAGIAVGTAVNVYLPAAMFRREAFEQIGNFNEDRSLSEDAEWFMRAAEQGIQPTILPIITLYHRMHTANMTLARMELRKKTMDTIKLSLDRRRQNGNLAMGPLLPWVQLIESAPPPVETDSEDKVT